MELVVINSGSSGNGYALICNSEILLIEAGCKLMDMKKAIGFQTSKIVGCLISHEHGDHSKYMDDYQRFGIKCYGSGGTQKSLEAMSGERITVLTEKKQLGGFTIHPFNLPHGEVDNYGYLISHMDIGRLLFLTDYEYCKYKFKDINHIITECNYSKDYLDTEAINRDHVLTGHAELETVKGLISANKSPSLMNVCLCHISGTNGNASRFRDEVNQDAGEGVNVSVAEKGLRIDLATTPF